MPEVRAEALSKVVEHESPLARQQSMIAIVTALLAFSAQTTYRVDLLRPIGGAQDVNNAGVVIGGMFPGYRWDKGKSVDLPEDLGDPRLINDQGDLVGDWFDLATNSPRAVLLHGKERLVLPVLVNHRESHAYAINASGTVVGESLRYIRGKPVKWSANSIQELSLLEGDTFGYATGINASGQIVGVSRSSSANHPVFYGENTTKPTPLPLADGVTSGDAWAINSAGTIVGRCWRGKSISACMWMDGKIEFLEGLPGQTDSEAKAINENGEIVGKSGPTIPLFGDGFVPDEMFQSHAVLWRSGKVYDLNDLVSYRDRKLFLFSALAINDKGQIVGEAKLGTEHVGYVLTPLER